MQEPVCVCAPTLAQAFFILFLVDSTQGGIPVRLDTPDGLVRGSVTTRLCRYGEPPGTWHRVARHAGSTSHVGRIVAADVMAGLYPARSAGVIGSNIAGFGLPGINRRPVGNDVRR